MTVKEKSITEKEEYTRAKRALLERLYKRLNDEQRRAVFRIKGPLLVLAGAGSGKTTVLTKRIEYIISFGDLYHSDDVPDSEKDLKESVKKMRALIESGTEEEIRQYLREKAVSPAFPWRVLCITFTNKAANEFKTRLSALLGDGAKDIWAGTFHSVCVRILRAHTALLGFSNGFTIYDTDDTKRVIGSVIKRLDIDEKLISAKGIRHEISRIKEKGLLPDDYEEEATTEREEIILRVYRAYQAELQSSSAMDFDDIILYTTLLFENHPEVLNKYRDQFDYILVDEYQDTNPSQSKLVYMLAGTKRNVCVVGDDDQSIYSFRGATIENILNFDKVFPDAEIVRLEQNYRSTKTILSAANAIISNNKGRKGKELWTGGDEGERIILKKQLTQSEESGYIVNYVKEKVASGARYSDFAVLYRQNAQANALEIILSKSHIPYRVYGGMRFYDHKEIKDLLAYLSVIDNPNDNLRLKRIINVPKRAIGATTVQYLSDISEKTGRSVFEIMRSADQYEELQKASSKLNAFCDLIDEMRTLSTQVRVSSLIEEIIKRIKYKEMLLESDADKEKADLPDELVSGAIMFEEGAEDPSLKAFLEDVALVSDIDNYENDANAVTLMTIHSAKGLEFPTVFLPGFEEGVFPSQQVMAGTEAEMEEERRLAYVAVTRAKKMLIITYTNTRLLYGRTSSNPLSRFATEIPKECVTIEQPVKAPFCNNVSESKRKFVKSRDSFIRNTASVSSRQPVQDEPPVSLNIAVGDKVNHFTFGDGVVTTVLELPGGDALYGIRFSDGTVRKLMGKFAKLKKL